MSIFRSTMPVKLVLDAAMTLGFVVSLAFRLTGGRPHEFIGLGVCALFTLHCVLNARWFWTWNKGRYDAGRTLRSGTNILLIVCMAVLFVTGLMNSRYAFGFLQLEGGMAVRQAHSFAAYWGIVLIGTHVGIHWQKVMAALRATAAVQPGARRARIVRSLALVLVAYGIWASIDRDMGAKLFQGFAFDFWDPARPSFLFYTHNIAIIGLYACCGYYGLKLLHASARSVRPRSRCRDRTISL